MLLVAPLNYTFDTRLHPSMLGRLGNVGEIFKALQFLTRDWENLSCPWSGTIDCIKTWNTIKGYSVKLMDGTDGSWEIKRRQLKRKTWECRDYFRSLEGSVFGVSIFPWYPHRASFFDWFLSLTVCSVPHSRKQSCLLKNTT